MPQTINPVFNNFYDADEQDLQESLVIEAIQIHGIELVYIPRILVNFDPLYAEDPLSQFKEKYNIEAYIKNIDSYDGVDEFVSKFGYEIRNEITFDMSIKRFTEMVVQPCFKETGKNIIRPKEGDLIYFSIDKRIFEISKCNKRSVFFQLGSLYMYEINCKEFELGGEHLDTGLDVIDTEEDNYAYAVEFTMGSGFGDFIIGEIVSGDSFRGKVIAWNDITMKLKVSRTKNSTKNPDILVGEDSGATYNIITNAKKNVNETVVVNNDILEPTNLIIPKYNPLTG